MKQPIPVLATCVLALLISACSSQSVQPSYYLLRPEQLPGSGAISPSQKFAFGKLHVAAYIDQPGILLEIASGEVRAARHHLWAEPVHEGLVALLSQEISRQSGENLLPDAATPGAARINIRIDQLHGTHDGRALLVAYWWLETTEGTENAEQFAQYKELESDGYAALASAQKHLLSALASRIATVLATTGD